MKKYKLLPILYAAVMLSGCSKAKNENLPEDNPCNHIREYSIMETENGYYTNLSDLSNIGRGGKINLKFIERDTKKEVYLCARPECQHNGGEMCTATYKDLYKINSVLYDGAIYTLVVEEINESVSFSIYRSALDGSSITRVGSAFSVNNLSDESYCFRDESFIIHKGYAYVPYHLSFGETMFGFAGSGLARMNLADGSSEILYSGEGYYSEYPSNLQGSGDYVYYDIFGERSDAGAYAYNINDGTTEKLEYLTSKCTYIAGENFFVTYSYNFMEDYDYKFAPHDICTVDKKTGRTVNLMHIEDPENILCESALPYKDMVIVTVDSGVYVYSQDGELITEVGSLRLEDYDMESHSGTAISEDKLYLYNVAAYTDWKYYFYSCPIEDILAGKGEWKFEYDVNMSG